MEAIASRKRTVKAFVILIVLFFKLHSITYANHTTNTAIYNIDPIVFAGDDPTDPELNDAAVKERLSAMFCSITPQYTDVVKSYIRGYVGRNRDRTEKILGRSIVMFPVIEKALREANLPDDMKFIAVLESALNPKAVSPAGATGIWQLMYNTALEQGLVIDTYVDERSDVTRSTTAAVKYLGMLYKKYGDWALALAAYNAGPSRVNEAIKKGHSNNFWKIQKFLSKQTQYYVPAFLAAAYAMQYYMTHGVQPTYPELDWQITKTIPIETPVSFLQLAQITQLPLYTIEQLNPAYIKGFVPASKGRSCEVTLPVRTMKLFQAYLDNPQGWIFTDATIAVANIFENNDKQYYKTSYTVREGDCLESVAKLFNCTAHSIRAWNNLASNYVYKDQELTVYLTEIPRRADSNEELPRRKHISTPKKINTMPAKQPVSEHKPTRHTPSPLKKTAQISNRNTPIVAGNMLSGTTLPYHNTLYREVEYAETLTDYIQKYPELSDKDVTKLKTQFRIQPPQNGMKLLIKSF
ncbi:MAG: transglycosylase SLT domain-containing protein [Saprospiraceae bacterium]|nr:transglycosylase SLT domain-containing protein [Saprospiraceae bacterium]MBP7680089.1 transglycosylase SLT domain-containing protein [Saprospiraceae bacterium]